MRGSHGDHGNSLSGFHRRHEAVHAIVFTGVSGAFLMEAKPVADEFPVFRVAAPAEEQKALAGDIRRRDEGLFCEPVLPAHGELPGNMKKRGPT